MRYQAALRPETSPITGGPARARVNLAVRVVNARVFVTKRASEARESEKMAVGTGRVRIAAADPASRRTHARMHGALDV